MENEKSPTKRAFFVFKICKTLLFIMNSSIEDICLAAKSPQDLTSKKPTNEIE